MVVDHTSEFESQDMVYFFVYIRTSYIIIDIFNLFLFHRILTLHKIMTIWKQKIKWKITRKIWYDIKSTLI